MRPAALIGVAAVLLAGCTPPPAPLQQDDVSWRARAENSPARIEKSWRVSESETVKILIVPGFPLGERCVIYSTERGDTMQCREITPSAQ